MFKDMFGRELHIGDFIYYTEINQMFYPNVSNFGIIVGDNCVVNSYYVQNSYGEKLLCKYYFRSALLINNLSEEELELKNKLQQRLNDCRYKNTKDKEQGTGILIFKKGQFKTTRGNGKDILGKEIQAGDLVLLKNPLVSNESLDKVHLGFCVGANTYAVFDRDADIQVLEFTSVYKINDECEEIAKVKNFLFMKYNQMIQAKLLNEKRIKDLKYRKHEIGELLYDKYEDVWVYLGRCQVKINEIVRTGCLYIKCADYYDETHVYDVKQEVYKSLYISIANMLCTKINTKKLCGELERVKVTLCNFDSPLFFDLGSYKIEISKLE